MKQEKGAIRMEGSLETTIGEINFDNITCYIVTQDPIPLTTVRTFHPRGCLGIGHYIVAIFIAKELGIDLGADSKRIAKLKQGITLIGMT